MKQTHYSLPDDDLGRPLRSRKALLSAGVVAVAVLLVGGVYLLLPRQTETLTPVTGAPPGATKPRRAPVPEPIKTPDRPGDQARALIAQIRAQGDAPNVTELFAKAEEFRSAGLVDDAYLLHFLAARSGHAPSAFELGKMYDPNRLSGTGGVMEEPDAGQAYKWYAKATESGHPGARDRLDQLRVWLERAARAGDSEAQRLLMQWR